MIRAFRNLAAIMLLLALAACGSKATAPVSNVPQFKRYDGPPVTQVVVNKGARQMHLLSGRTVLKSYKIGLGNRPVGEKVYEGDGKTPEGIYFIDRFNPRSRYHLSVGINYPSPSDTARALAMGLKPGGDIFIHGRGPEGEAARLRGVEDWTAGCIAVENAEIEEIFAMLRPGTPIVINP